MRLPIRSLRRAARSPLLSPRATVRTPRRLARGLLRWARVLARAMYNARTARDETAYQKQSDAEVQRLTGQGATPAAPRAAPGGASLERLTLNASIAMRHRILVLFLIQRSYHRKTGRSLRRHHSSLRCQSRNGSSASRAMKAAESKGCLHISWRTLAPWRLPLRQVSGDGREHPGVDAAYFGQEMTPQEFLADKDAQEASRTRAGQRVSRQVRPRGRGGCVVCWREGNE